jgi:uracil-DNA glycosylase
MRVSECIGCDDFPCVDVKHGCYKVPEIDLDPEKISVMMISEAAPQDASDYYYSGADSLFEKTTILAFNDAGAEVESIQDLVDMGVYFTTAVKCGKTSYNIKAATIKQCSQILEQEIDLFPNVEIFMLMGDVAIKAINYIAKRAGEPRVIPAGSTYKIRGEPFFYKDKRAFPSYLQAGPSFFIEKSKRRMIAEDIGLALDLLKSDN